MTDIRLIHGDCLEAMKGYPDNYFDIAIVDPPYGIGINHNIGRRKGNKHSGHKRVNWDKAIPEQEYFDELFRVSKNQIIWGGNYFIMPPCKCFIIYQKPQISENVSFSMCEYAWTSFDKSAKIIKIHNSENRIHPTQKPIKLYKWLLENYTNENDLILDTHLGSGSIAIACHYMKRRLIGYEIDEEYYNAACKRFKEQAAQQTLF